MTYGDVHRFFLRTVASRGVLSIPEANEILNGYEENNSNSIESLIKDINKEIRPLQQTIKLVTDEVTEEEAIVFLSLGEDELSRSQNIFSAVDLEYFRILLEDIVVTNRREISGIQALNLVGRMKGNLLKTDAQRLLDKWCQMKYLEKLESAYGLGIRAIHEFEGYIRQNLPDAIEECSLCKRIVYRGCNCPHCGLALHTRCLNKYLEKIEKWPCCKNEYTPLTELTQNVSRITVAHSSTMYDEPSSSSQANTLVLSQENSESDISTQDSSMEVSQTKVLRSSKRRRLQ